MDWQSGDLSEDEKKRELVLHLALSYQEPSEEQKYQAF